MAIRYSGAEYLYASARIRANENSLLGRERLNALLEMKTAKEIETALPGYGFETVARADGSADTEAMLMNAFENGISLVRQSVPDPELTWLVQHPYDCHNIKSVLKCRIRGIDPAPLLIPAGTVPVERLLGSVELGSVEGVPAHMAAAVPEAEKTFSADPDPRSIDFCLDRACFADQADAAAGFSFAEELIRAKADLTNILICLRLLRMGVGALGLSLLRRAFVPGGTISEDAFLRAYEGGEALLCEMLSFTPYCAVLPSPGKLSPAAAEKNADDCLMERIRKARFLPSGPEIPLAYLFGLETSIRNLRIVLAGKAAGLNADTIRERMRESYV